MNIFSFHCFVDTVVALELLFLCPFGNLPTLLGRGTLINIDFH